MNPARLKPKHSVRNSITVVVLLLWLALLGWAFYSRQGILDWWRLRNYTVPAAVSQLATDDAMTASARHIFYVNEPKIEDKAGFTQCNANSEQTIVLGCYHGDQNGIFVLAVSDPRLQGVEQVTSAHEMLHAAYDRLGAHDKQSVNAMLEDFYQHDLHDQRILDTIAAYKVSEPNDVVNEMHSVFGTEVANLPPALEQYYQRYFTDRSKVTSFAAQYEGEFTSRQNIVKADDTQLAGLKVKIDQQEADLKSRLAALNAQGAHLQALKAANSISAYNAGVAPYNADVDAYNAEVASVKSLIRQYNDLVNARNAVVLETKQLTNEISSQPSSISK